MFWKPFSCWAAKVLCLTLAPTLTLTSPFVEDEIFPKILDLALNRDADKQGDTNRADFTRVLLQLAGPLGEEAAIRLLLKSKGSEPRCVRVADRTGTLLIHTYIQYMDAYIRIDIHAGRTCR